MIDPKSWTAEYTEEILCKALSRGDIKTVEAALILLTSKNPKRASELYDSMKLALKIANAGGPSKALAMVAELLGVDTNLNTERS